jgi:putative hydrolase
MLRDLLGALEIDPRSFLRVPDVTDLRKLFDRVREDGLAMVVVGAGRRETLDRVQAFMAVLEGYAEHVMDAVGETVLDDLPAMRAAMQRRRRDRSGLLKLLERLIGMDLKLRQYEQGKAFCDGVVARAGIEGLNRVWASPDSLPTVAELSNPAGWLARTERPHLRESA